MSPRSSLAEGADDEQRVLLLRTAYSTAATALTVAVSPPISCADGRGWDALRSGARAMTDARIAEAAQQAARLAEDPNYDPGWMT